MWLGIGLSVAATAHAVDQPVSSQMSGAESARARLRARRNVGGAAVAVRLGAGDLHDWPAHQESACRRAGLRPRARAISHPDSDGPIKMAVRRGRPDGTRFSFPSGHSAVTFASATVLQQHFGWKVGVPAYAVAAYVAASRSRRSVTSSATSRLARVSASSPAGPSRSAGATHGSPSRRWRLPAAAGVRSTGSARNRTARVGPCSSMSTPCAPDLADIQDAARRLPASPDAPPSPPRARVDARTGAAGVLQVREPAARAAPSSSAAPTTRCRACRPTSAAAASSPSRPATTRRRSRSPASCSTSLASS